MSSADLYGYVDGNEGISLLYTDRLLDHISQLVRYEATHMTVLKHNL